MMYKGKASEAIIELNETYLVNNRITINTIDEYKAAIGTSVDSKPALGRWLTGKHRRIKVAIYIAIVASRCPLSI